MKNSGKILLITGLLLAVGAMPSFAQALGGQKLLNSTNRMEQVASREATAQQTQLQNVIKRSDTLITNRITTLNTLLTRIQNDTRLTAAEKSSFTSDVQTDISGLTALKTKIDADTDVTTAREDAKTIITGYYVYAVFEPKVRLHIVLNNLQTVSTNVQNLVPQIQNLINSLQSQGKDVTELQAQLNDVNTQLQTINTTLAKDITTVEGITATTGPSSAEQSFAKVRQDIAQLVRAGFAKIRSDFAQMRPLFNKLIISKVTPEPTSPTSTGSASQ